MAGTFVLSLDAELAWGSLDKNGSRLYRRHFESMRQNYPLLLKLLEKYDISATWAFVGHLFLGGCHRGRDSEDPHPDVLTVQFPWYKGHWHEPDPGTNRSVDPFWYGDDLLEMVLSARPQQEIACHTFSHLPLGDPAVNSETARSQLVKCCQLAEKRGFRLRSLVFPRNLVAHLPVLDELDFTCYRGPERSWYTRLPRPMARVGHFLHRLLGLPPPVYQDLAVHSGVVNIPASMFLMPADGVRALIPGRSRVRQASLGLRASAKSDSVFHLWFHPWNTGGSPAMLQWLEAILEEVDSLRSRGQIRVKTMGALANEVLSRVPTDTHSGQRILR